MSDTHNIDIPQAMIDKARDEWHLHDARVIDDGDYGWIWMCECSATGAAGDEDECMEDADRHEFSAALAAALAECEVTEEFGHSKKVAGAQWHSHQCPTSDLRRLVVVTPAQEETANE